VEGDNSVEDKRRWPRRITLALVVVPIVLALPKFLLAIAHARADSQVGVMMYGFPPLSWLVLWQSGGCRFCGALGFGAH
jgi:hypothetical protein